MSGFMRRLVMAVLVVTAAAVLLQIPDCIADDTVYADGELLRLHVVANSDSALDQALKQQVRDRILHMVSAELQPDATAEETLAYFRSNANRIRWEARHVLQQNDCDEPVRVTIGEHWFPQKSFKTVVVPAGSYKAVRIVLGRGEGRNWWCVMFPPLCFNSSEITPAQVRTVLAQTGPVLDEETLSPQVQYQVRSRLLEWARSLPREDKRLRLLLSWLR